MKLSNKLLCGFALFVMSCILVVLVSFRAIVGNADTASSKVKQGSSSVITKDFPITDFTGVSTSGDWKIEIVKDKGYKVQIATTEKIMNQLNVRNETGELMIDNLSRDNSIFFDTGKNSIRICMPELKSVDLSGDSSVMINNFISSTLKIDVSGDSKIEAVNCVVTDCTFEISGDSDMNFLKSKIRNLDLQVSGDSSIKVNMDGGELTGDVSGSSEIQYAGSISSQKIDASGDVSVKKM